MLIVRRGWEAQGVVFESAVCGDVVTFTRSGLARLCLCKGVSGMWRLMGVISKFSHKLPVKQGLETCDKACDEWLDQWHLGVSLRSRVEKEF